MSLAVQRVAPSRSKRRRWPLVLAVAVVGVLTMAAASTHWLATFGGKLAGARLERARRSPRFDGKRFVNPVATNMHWGTFNLAFHAWNAPAEEALAAAAARGVAIAIPRPGEWVEPAAPPPIETWWR